MNTVAEIQAEINRVVDLPHHRDMYGHQPGCGVCGKLQSLYQALQYVQGCPGCKRPYDEHIGHVGGLSGACPKPRRKFTYEGWACPIDGAANTHYHDAP